jgi:hypothetical protein
MSLARSLPWVGRGRDSESPPPGSAWRAGQVRALVVGSECCRGAQLRDVLGACRHGLWGHLAWRVGRSLRAPGGLHGTLLGVPDGPRPQPGLPADENHPEDSVGLIWQPLDRARSRRSRSTATADHPASSATSPANVTDKVEP